MTSSENRRRQACSLLCCRVKKTDQTQFTALDVFHITIDANKSYLLEVMAYHFTVKTTKCSIMSFK